VTTTTIDWTQTLLPLAGKGTAPPEAAPVRVIVVEDDEVDAMAVRRNLNRSGAAFDVVDVPRLGDAAALLETQSFDCVLLDLDLPDSRGLATVLAMVDDDFGPAIVVLTGRKSQRLAIEAVAAGAQDYLPKDELTTPVLVRSITYAVARQALARELRNRTMALADANERLLRAESRLRDLAEHDTLTGVLTRRAFEICLGGELHHHRTSGGRFALFYCDLDGFKPVNDRYGHQAGDQVLVACVRRIRSCVRNADLIGRVGGDEFLVLCRDVASDLLIEKLGQRLSDCMSEPLEIDGQRVQVGVSIGILVVDETSGPVADGPAGITTLVSQADVAMYAAKSAGGGGWTLVTAP
jgi:diguanylate cyclase (GGDEF)-like protein